MPLVSALTVSGDPVPYPVRDACPLAVQVAVYAVMCEPPLLSGKVKAIVALLLPGVAAPILGGLGTVGLTAMLAVTCGATS